MTNESTAGVTGAHTTDGRPHGLSSITPFLAIAGAREAIEFYRDVLGARVVDVTEMLLRFEAHGCRPLYERPRFRPAARLQN